MHTNRYKYIKLIEYKALTLWDVKRYLEGSLSFGHSIKLREVLQPYRIPISKEEMLVNNWQIISKINFAGNLFLRDINENNSFKGNLNKVDADSLIYSKINVRHGCVYYHPKNAITFGVSSEYPVYKIDSTRAIGEFLVMVLQSDFFKAILNKKVTGISKARLKPDEFLDTEIPLLSLQKQKDIVSAYNSKIEKAKDLELNAQKSEQSIESYFFEVLEIDKKQNEEKINHKSFLKFIRFETIKVWGYDKLIWERKMFLQSKTCRNKRLGDILEINPITSFLKISKDTEISFIPMECISGEYGELKEKRKCTIAYSKGYTKFQNGDLIWARITPCMQNGKSAIVDDLTNGYGCGSTEFHVLRNHNKQLSLEYIHILLRLPVVLKDAMKSFTGSSGQKRVPKSYLEDLSVPIPSLQKQNIIVDYVRGLIKRSKMLRQKAINLRSVALKEFENEVFE